MTKNYIYKSRFQLAVLSGLLTLSMPLLSFAAGDEGFYAGQGEIHVSGQLTESACSLDMSSANQSVEMGNISTASLKKTGNRGEAVPVQFRLVNCHRSASNNRDNQGNLTWSNYSPSVSFSFMAEADKDNPNLVRAKGVSGLGLRITDADMRDVVLGQRGNPLLLTPGDDLVTYYLSPERTMSPLKAGAYNTLIMYRLNYE